MAEPLKNFFDAKVVRAIGKQLAVGFPSLDVSKFCKRCLAGLDELELLARGWHIAEVMRQMLPQDFPTAAAILTGGLGAPLAADTGNGMTPFRYLPHMSYISKYGVDHLEESLAALHALTQHFTAEYSIRTFIERYPAPTYARLQTWATDPSVHVRRLVSEGTRPRLPWAGRLKAYQRDPAPVIALLELLKDDSERYVQRSVANNLNDITKDHPDVALAVCTRWLENPTPTRRWIVSHALRGLVKQAHPGALKLLGVGAKPSVKLLSKQLPERAHIGETVAFNCELLSTTTEAQILQVDFRVHFVKANGNTQPKVFKLKRIELGPKTRTALRGSISFRVHTTRKPHPGAHLVELSINGQAFRLGVVRIEP